MSCSDNGHTRHHHCECAHGEQGSCTCNCHGQRCSHHGHCCCCSHEASHAEGGAEQHDHHEGPEAHDRDHRRMHWVEPMAILDRRLAAGRIDIEDYQARKAILNQGH